MSSEFDPWATAKFVPQAVCVASDPETDWKEWNPILKAGRANGNKPRNKWCNYKASTWSSSVRDFSVPPFLITLRGAVMTVHDRALAQQMAHDISKSLAANAELSLTSGYGHGWRSRLVHKKFAKYSSEMPPVTTLHVGSQLDYETEVKARLAAVEVAIRAQVQTQFNGKSSHSSCWLVGKSASEWRNFASHNYRNNKPFAETSTEDHRRQSRGRCIRQGQAPMMTENAENDRKQTAHGSDGTFHISGLWVPLDGSSCQSENIVEEACEANVMNDCVAETSVSVDFDDVGSHDIIDHRTEVQDHNTVDSDVFRGNSYAQPEYLKAGFQVNSGSSMLRELVEHGVAQADNSEKAKVVEDFHSADFHRYWSPKSLPTAEGEIRHLRGLLNDATLFQSE